MPAHYASFDAHSATWFRRIAAVAFGFTWLAVLTPLASHGQTPVRIPIPTERLLQLQSDEPQTDQPQSDEPQFDALLSELDENESTSALDGPATEADQAAPDQPSDQARRDQTVNKHLSLLRKPIYQIDLHSDFADKRVPENRAEQLGPHEAPIFISSMGYRVPPPDRYTIYQSHRPLYYEQPNLERCGNAYGVLQNAISGAIFLANTVVLPYKIGKDSPNCEVPAGGDCKTCQSYPLDCGLLPVDKHGITMELAALAGFTFLVL